MTISAAKKVVTKKMSRTVSKFKKKDTTQTKKNGFLLSNSSTLYAFMQFTGCPNGGDTSRVTDTKDVQRIYSFFNFIPLKSLIFSFPITSHICPF